MEKFAAFAAKRRLDDWTRFQRSHVVDFLRTLYLRKLDSRSVARHLVTIRHFFRFAFTEGIINEDPAANIQSPKFRRSLPEFLSVAGSRPPARAAGRQQHTMGLRDKAMIELLYSTGLRVSELCGLKSRRPANGSRAACAASAREIKSGSFRWAARALEAVVQNT